jgi:ribosomal protein S21
VQASQLFAGFGFVEFSLPRHRVSRTRRTLMGVRIVVADKEPIALALKRFKRSLEQHGVNWEMRKRGFLIQPKGCIFKATAAHRAKKFQKRFKARKATLLAKMAGEQATDSPASELKTVFWKRTGKP